MKLLPAPKPVLLLAAPREPQYGISPVVRLIEQLRQNIFASFGVPPEMVSTWRPNAIDHSRALARGAYAPRTKPTKRRVQEEEDLWP